MTFTTRPDLQGTFGAVAATHWIAAAAGMRMLERGGNAFDAAAAAGFVLQVVEPHLNGPGGEVPILASRAGEDAPRVICGQGPAPRGATIRHFAALGLDTIPGSGHLAACVPGAFGAWLTLLRDWGTMRLADVLEPAIFHAGGGHRGEQLVGVDHAEFACGGRQGHLADIGQREIELSQRLINQALAELDGLRATQALQIIADSCSGFGRYDEVHPRRIRHRARCRYDLNGLAVAQLRP
jgi:hypothetical protein